MPRQFWTHTIDVFLITPSWEIKIETDYMRLKIGKEEVVSIALVF